MKSLLAISSYLALVLLVIAPVLFYMDRLTLEQNKTCMLLGTSIWFITACTHSVFYKSKQL